MEYHIVTKQWLAVSKGVWYASMCVHVHVEAQS